MSGLEPVVLMAERMVAWWDDWLDSAPVARWVDSMAACSAGARADYSVAMLEPMLVLTQVERMVVPRVGWWGDSLEREPAGQRAESWAAHWAALWAH